MQMGAIPQCKAKPDTRRAVRGHLTADAENDNKAFTATKKQLPSKQSKQTMQMPKQNNEMWK